MVTTPANQDAADSPQGGTLTKAAILAELRSQLSARLVTAQQAAADAFAAATHEEARAENKYDTRALEQSYLSAGQNARIAALRDLIAAVHFYLPPPEPPERVGLGALVGVEVERGDHVQHRWLLLLPFKVGETLQVAGHEVFATDVHAPMALALLGREEGDSVAFPGDRLPRTLTVVSVA